MVKKCLGDNDHTLHDNAHTLHDNDHTLHDRVHKIPVLNSSLHCFSQVYIFTSV